MILYHNGPVLMQKLRGQFGRNEAALLFFGRGALKEDARLARNEPIVSGPRLEIRLMIALVGAELKTPIGGTDSAHTKGKVFLPGLDAS